MTTMFIELKSMDTVKNFVNDIRAKEGDFDLISGRYIVDAKSIMGIFSLDLSKPLELHMSVDDASVVELLKKYSAQ